MLSFLYVYSDHSILECYNLFSGVELSMRLFFVIQWYLKCYFQLQNAQLDILYLSAYTDAVTTLAEIANVHATTASSTELTNALLQLDDIVTITYDTAQRKLEDVTRSPPLLADE